MGFFSGFFGFVMDFNVQKLGETPENHSNKFQGSKIVLRGASIWYLIKKKLHKTHLFPKKPPSNLKNLKSLPNSSRQHSQKRIFERFQNPIKHHLRRWRLGNEIRSQSLFNDFYIIYHKRFSKRNELDFFKKNFF